MKWMSRGTTTTLVYPLVDQLTKSILRSTIRSFLRKTSISNALITKNILKAIMTSCILSIIGITLSQNVSMTKRDVFYMNVKLFKAFPMSSLKILFVCSIAREPSWIYLVVIKELSFVILFLKKMIILLIVQNNINEGKVIPHDMENVEIIHFKASFILWLKKMQSFFFWLQKNSITIFHA